MHWMVRVVCKYTSLLVYNHSRLSDNVMSSFACHSGRAYVNVSYLPACVPVTCTHAAFFPEYRFSKNVVSIPGSTTSQRMLIVQHPTERACLLGYCFLWRSTEVLQTPCHDAGAVCICRTAIHLASREGHAAMIRLIISNMSDHDKEVIVNQRDMFGLTPVYLSLQRWVPSS